MGIFLVVIIGGLIGVVINYLADVLPRSRNFARPVCPKCETPYSLRGYLISFRCATCGARPSVRYFIVMILSIIISVLSTIYPFDKLNFWSMIPIIIFLGLILVIDIEHRVVLIQTSIAGIVLFFVYGIIINGLLITLIGGAAGLVIMLFFYYFGILFNKILGKIRNQTIDEVALGFGDVYVCTFLGLLTGWPLIVGTILLGILASGVFSIIYLVFKVLSRKYEAFTAIPYAPFLILGAIATFYLQI
jgi:leader peptidase (prepilin peptidase) / N-methyltransferase